jgi:hypothetical protein
MYQFLDEQDMWSLVEKNPNEKAKQHRTGAN